MSYGTPDTYDLRKTGDAFRLVSDLMNRQVAWRDSLRIIQADGSVLRCEIEAEREPQE